MENTYCVYKHTSPSGKVYIGITRKKPEIRWANGKGYAYNRHFTNAINKYGWDNFKHEILLDGLNSDQASEYEKLYIYMYKSNDSKYGYNITSGGEKGFSLQGEHKDHFDELMRNPQRRKKISEGLKEYYRSPEAREKASEAQKKKWQNGIIRENARKSAKDRWKDSEYRKNLIDKLTKLRNTNEYKQSMTGGNNPNATSVLQYSLDGKLVGKYDSINDACRAIGSASHSNIVACINGRRRTSYGYIWAYDKCDEEISHRVDELKSYVNPKAKAILQCDLNGNTIKQFHSITEVSEILNASSGTICMALKGRRKTAYGFIWKYA